MSSRIFVACPVCLGCGRKLESFWVYESGCGFPHEDVEDVGACPNCDGFGSEEIESEEITLEDLEAIP
jgi:hypothetical protein